MEGPGVDKKVGEMGKLLIEDASEPQGSTALFFLLLSVGVRLRFN